MSAQRNQLLLDAVTGVMLQLSGSNDGLACEGVIHGGFHSQILLCFKLNFSQQRTPELCLLSIRIPGINVVVHGLAKIRQLCEIEAVENCRLKLSP